MVDMQIQEALPLLLQLLFLVAVGALLVGFFVAIINFIYKNSAVIVMGLVLVVAWQAGIFEGVLG